MVNSLAFQIRNATLSLNSPNKPRIVRVRKNDVPGIPDREPSIRSEASPPVALAHDSLGWSLLLAARVLAKVRAGTSLTEALKLLEKESSSARAAAQDVAYGVLRQYGRGEFILGKLMSKALTHQETHELLLGALYRLETRPESKPMVVDQAVAASGEMAGGVFKGLVNGVLRNYLRQRTALIKAMSENDVALSQHPGWWLSKLRRAYPASWQSIVDADNSPPPMTLRVNSRRCALEDYLGQLASVGMSARPIGGQGLILERPVGVDALPGFFDGLVSVQDAGAQRAAELLAPQAGERVLDACAAPGGKTAHLLESVESLNLLALDIDAMRTRRIEENLKRLGLSATIKVGDCAKTSSWWDGCPFDAILADVPCSVSGVVRRHPDIKVLRRESDIRRLVHTQADILDALWPLLKPGGKPLYATCSVFPEENAAQIDAFLVRQSGVERVRQEQLVPSGDNDGFYYALLKKTA